jgi:TRAP-type C4-dicarboxylate transport system substrate-binding protein
MGGAKRRRAARTMSLVYAAIMGLAARPAAADEITLNIATTTPGDYVVARKIVTPWADRINAAGAGVLHVVPRNGATIAIAANVFDRVNADVVQMGVGIPGLIGSRFPLTEVIGLPFLVSDAEKGSVAFWRLYKTGMLDSEYTDFVPLAMSMYPAQGIHLAKAPAELDDLKGLRLRVASKVSSDTVTMLGGTALAFDPADIYASIQRGVIDGVAMA